MTKSISDMQQAIAQASKMNKKTQKVEKKVEEKLPSDVQKRIIELEDLMQKAAEKFDFEKAIALRVEWMELQKQLATK